MHKRANLTWNIPDGPASNEQAALAVLQDIRSELKKLNNVFQCENFQEIPFKLDAIRKNTTKRRRTRRHEKN
jgi:hypothetical protein